ncbi:MAG TPA: hypothetical protein VEI26_14025 [Terriglobales bacterium]|nr:hypothetical protein [Terriglobales bacterium]
MNRVTNLWLASVIVGAIAVVPGGAQNTTTQNNSTQTVTPQFTTTVSEPSLGSYARALKNDKKVQAAKKFDNDNLPREDKLSVVGEKDAANPQASDSSSADKAKPSTPAITPGESPEQRQQVYDQWKDRIATQQSEVDLLSRELDVEQREYKLRAAEFYGDAGDRMRNQAAWDKEDAEYKEKIADKQKAFDDAKQMLGDMQEEARKAGVPTSVRGEDQQPQQ